jgi:hypothetical protein
MLSFRNRLSNLLPIAQGLGAAAVLYKPFERTELLTVVRQSLSPSPA